MEDSVRLQIPVPRFGPIVKRYYPDTRTREFGTGQARSSFVKTMEGKAFALRPAEAKF